MNHCFFCSSWQIMPLNKLAWKFTKDFVTGLLKKKIGKCLGIFYWCREKILLLLKIVNENSDEILPSETSLSGFLFRKKISIPIESSIEYSHLKLAFTVYFSSKNPLKFPNCQLNIKKYLKIGKYRRLRWSF
jgi:hypothetical protein